MCIDVKVDDTSLEIYAKIFKATANKYDCSVNIDFQNGNRMAEFVGDKTCEPHIAEEVQNFVGTKFLCP